jgi:hypothetical protein
VTEAEWLACEDPRTMVSYLGKDAGKSKGGRRQIRLLLSACCRREWHYFVDARSRELIESSESYADGLLSYRDFKELWDEVFNAHSRGAEGAHLACMAAHYQIRAAAKDGWPRVTNGESVPNAAEKAHLVRDIFGNPFRKAAFSKTWRTDTAMSLAQQMYESREFGAMPILADALQDAGCDSDDILNHCRDANATHVRGCWVVDLVIGKE